MQPPVPERDPPSLWDRRTRYLYEVLVDPRCALQEVEAHVRVGSEQSKPAHGLQRGAARRHVGDAPGRERNAGIGDVDQGLQQFLVGSCRFDLFVNDIKPLIRASREGVSPTNQP